MSQPFWRSMSAVSVQVLVFNTNEGRVSAMVAGAGKGIWRGLLVRLTKQTWRTVLQRLVMTLNAQTRFQGMQGTMCMKQSALYGVEPCRHWNSVTCQCIVRASSGTEKCSENCMMPLKGACCSRMRTQRTLRSLLSLSLFSLVATLARFGWSIQIWMIAAEMITHRQGQRLHFLRSWAQQPNFVPLNQPD